MKLTELVRHVPVVDVHGSLEPDVDHVTRDSREVRPRSVFVAIEGATVDGHRFAAEVDAAAVVVQQDVEVRDGVTRIRVPDTKVALAQLAAALHDTPGGALPVVGVTGTNGKTTVTTLIEGALRTLGWSVGRIGTTGNALDGVPRPTRFTTPEAPELQALLAEMRDEGAGAVAMEVSSIGLAQHRVDGIPFAVAVFTNLTRDHLDFHGTMEAYEGAKSRLFRELLRPAGGAPRALLCADDPAHTRMGAPDDAWTYGFAEDADLHIAEAIFADTGIELQLRTPDGALSMSSPMLGRHNALNLVAAVGALRCLGEDWAAAAEAVGSVAGVPGRLERIPDAAGRLVLVDYAHSSDALEHVLRTVREVTRGALWVVFGCGGDRDRGKRPVMGRVASAAADRVVVTSDNPRSEDPEAIVDAILGGIEDRAGVRVEVDRAEAIRFALGHAGPGDAVVIAGKGHETTQEIAGVKHPFDDRHIARAALEES